jgi:hypothetical protein
MRSQLLVAAALLGLFGCGSAVDPSQVDLSGRWQAQPNLLGIGTLNLDLTEANGEITGTGSYTPATDLVEGGTVAATGIHIGGEVNMNLTFTPDGGQPVRQNFAGHIDDQDHFVLVFPGDNADRVTFTRQ